MNKAFDAGVCKHPGSIHQKDLVRLAWFSSRIEGDLTRDTTATSAATAKVDDRLGSVLKEALSDAATVSA